MLDLRRPARLCGRARARGGDDAVQPGRSRRPGRADPAARAGDRRPRRAGDDRADRGRSAALGRLPRRRPPRGRAPRLEGRGRAGRLAAAHERDRAPRAHRRLSRPRRARGLRVSQRPRRGLGAPADGGGLGAGAGDRVRQADRGDLRRPDSQRRGRLDAAARGQGREARDGRDRRLARAWLPGRHRLAPERRPGRARAGALGDLLRHQPGARLGGCGGALREPAQRLLAAAPRGGLHAAPARARRAVRAARLRLRDHERGLSHDAGLGRPAPGRFRRRCGAARADRASSSGRARSASSARRPTAAPSASGPSSGSRSAASARRRSSCSRPPRRRTRPCRGTSGCAGSAPSGSSSVPRASDLRRLPPVGGGSGHSPRATVLPKRDATLAPTARPLHRDSFLVAPPVRDRRPPVAAERLRAQLHPGRRLAALVLGAVDHRAAPARRRRDRSRRRAAPRASGRARRRPRARGRAAAYGGSESSSRWSGRSSALGARSMIEAGISSRPARSFRWRARRKTSVL